mgnify:CR=1 FL=1
MVTAVDKKEQIQTLLNEAKVSPVKGRMYVYEQYKRELLELNPTQQEYDETCIKLAKYLQV